MSELSGGALDTLIALVECGPLFDGDVPSKSGRSELLQLGLAVQVVVKGEDGYQAATYAGAKAYKDHFGQPTMAEARAERMARRAVISSIHKVRAG